MGKLCHLTRSYMEHGGIHVQYNIVDTETMRRAQEKPEEHKDLVDSIVFGNPIVELNQTAESSLTSVIGRMAAYTGKRVTWDFATKKSKLDLFPKELDLDGEISNPPFAVPGQEMLI